MKKLVFMACTGVSLVMLAQPALSGQAAPADTMAVGAQAISGPNGQLQPPTPQIPNCPGDPDCPE